MLQVLLASVVLVVHPNTRLQLWFGSVIAASALACTIQMEPYQSIHCQRAQIIAQLQILFTYLSAQVYFQDPDVASREARDAATSVGSDLGLVFFNSGVFAFLVGVLCNGVHAALTANTLCDLHGLEVAAPKLPKGQDFHLFLSHRWSSGQDQMRITKLMLLERIPDLSIFLGERRGPTRHSYPPLHARHTTYPKSTLVRRPFLSQTWTISSLDEARST